MQIIVSTIQRNDEERVINVDDGTTMNNAKFIVSVFYCSGSDGRDLKITLFVYIKRTDYESDMFKSEIVYEMYK